MKVTRRASWPVGMLLVFPMMVVTIGMAAAACLALLFGALIGRLQITTGKDDK